MTTDNPQKSYRILLVDDEIALIKTVSFVLKRAGHTIDAVLKGYDALEKIKANPDAYDVLVTDHTMAPMSGLELVKLVHGTPFRGTIVVLSANLTSAIEEAYHALGVTRFIYKPFELDDLRKAMQELPEPVKGSEIS